MKFRPLHDRVVVKRIDAELSSSASMPRKSLPAASSSRTPPRRSPRRARSSLLVRVAAMSPASSFQLMSKKVIACCSANGRALRSRLMAKNS